MAASFRPVFKGWIASLYSDISSMIRTNDHRSELFSIMCSVRQGCPLSTLLYVLVQGPQLHRLAVSRDILCEP